MNYLRNINRNSLADSPLVCTVRVTSSCCKMKKKSTNQNQIGPCPQPVPSSEHNRTCCCDLSLGQVSLCKHNRGRVAVTNHWDKCLSVNTIGDLSL